MRYRLTQKNSHVVIFRVASISVVLPKMCKNLKHLFKSYKFVTYVFGFYLLTFLVNSLSFKSEFQLIRTPPTFNKMYTLTSKSSSNTFSHCFFFRVRVTFSHCLILKGLRIHRKKGGAFWFDFTYLSRHSETSFNIGSRGAWATISFFHNGRFKIWNRRQERNLITIITMDT